MRKLFLFLILGVLLAVAVGCGEKPTPTSTPRPTATPTPVPPDETPAVTPSAAQAGCRMAPPFGQPLAGLPPVTAEDWVRGPADAPVTLIEYADFQ